MGKCVVSLIANLSHQHSRVRCLTLDALATLLPTGGEHLERCLLHLLQSEAGQLLNGQHVTLIKASIQQGRFQCKFDDGTIGNIKPENLQKIQSKPTTLRRHEEYEEDPCSICMEEVSITVPNTYRRYSCCGKLMHMKCSEQLYTSELSSQQKYSCPMCRTKNFENGSTEDIEQLRKWVERKKPWAMEYLASRYKLGCGVEQSDERAFELYKLVSPHPDNWVVCANCDRCFVTVRLYETTVG